MQSDDRPEDKHPGRGGRRAVARASALALGLGYLARKQESLPNPSMLLSGPKVEALNQLANDLAERGREDQDAVGQLRDAAGRHHRLLTRALALQRLGSHDGLSDDRICDRAERLLVAAATNEPIRAVSAEQEAWFGQVDSLEAGGSEAAFERLALRVPGLNVVEQEVRARVDANKSNSVDFPIDDDWWGQIYHRLEMVVGPRADLSEPILRSSTAFEIAARHLGTLAYILDD